MKLEAKELRKTFGETEILHGISFEVESGRALGLLGRNGAGKTTTIRILMDVFHANSGEILLDGKKFKPRSHQIGYLPEERGLYPKKTVIEQMVYLARLRGMNPIRAKENARRWLARLEVSEYETRKLETLSKGNQQKVQLAATLVCDPEIVILDEPFSGLDPVNSQILKDVVSELIEQNKLVIFSSHQMNYVEEFCEGIAIINHGEIVLSGDLSEIKKEFGRDCLTLSAENYTPSALAEVCRQSCGSLFETLCDIKGASCKKRIRLQTVLAQCMKEGLMSDLHDMRSQRSAQISDPFVSKLSEMRESKLHSFVIINYYIGNAGIGYNIIVIEDGRRPACTKIGHPAIGQSEAENKSAGIIVPKHKDVIGNGLLKLFRDRDDLYGISGRFRHLTESKNDIISELVRLFIFDILSQNTQLFVCLLSAQFCVAHSNGSLQDGFLQSFADIRRAVERFGDGSFGNAEFIGNILYCSHLAHLFSESVNDIIIYEKKQKSNSILNEKQKVSDCCEKM